ncbi:MAG: undecaprenyl-diphosphate phosphatase [Candidatus Micrarchaeota archaeon]|nr:undecaprenyl-diphosphate phosphatase [Candidatus Micrarchaeota archaeon]
MDIIQVIILGLVQAITEWLPLSSKTMDTILYRNVFGGSATSVVSVLLFLHLGTMLAATLYFRKEIIASWGKFFRSPLPYDKHKNTEFGFVVTALFFTGVVGVPILLIEKLFLPTLDASALMILMGAGLVVTGFLLTSQAKNRWRTTESVTWKDGILTGALQGLSTIPGVSRAGTSTTGLIWRGFDSESAFHLAFILSIPTVFIAEVVLWAAQGGISAIPISEGIALAVSSFVFGYLTIRVLLRVAHKMNIAWLAFAFGIMMLVFGLIGIG